MSLLIDIDNKIIHGNSLDVLEFIPDECIDLVVTSPPYYNLRNYKTSGQIGVEKTPLEYINNLISVFRECKRVLKRTGSIWVNISDSYNDNRSLIGIPERFAIMMQDELDLIRRNSIIWHKPNCMPSSVKNRFTIDFEYFYWFTKSSSKYYFETQYQPFADSTLKQFKTEYKGKGIKDYEGNGVQNPSDVKRRIIKFGGTKYPNNVENVTYSGNEFKPDVLGSIKRTTWRISPNNYKGAHFATYPEKLIETPIKACCPPQICVKCGHMRKKIVRSLLKDGSVSSNTKANIESNKSTWEIAERRQYYRSMGYESTPYIEDGYDTCDCNAGFQSGIVLDPFLGSGTTCILAKKMGRRYLGIDINQDYITIAENRLRGIL